MQLVHVRDVARAALRVAEEPAAIGRAYTLATNPPSNPLQIVQLLAYVAGGHADLVHIRREQIERLGGQLFTPRLYSGVYLAIPLAMVRNDRARSELGLDLTPLEEGLRETYLWYRQEQRPRPDFSWEECLLTA